MEDDFETDLKRLIRKHFEAGNAAMPDEGGCPSDYGFLDDEDMGKILAKAARVLNGEIEPDCDYAIATGDYLYHHPPLPGMDHSKFLEHSLQLSGDLLCDVEDEHLRAIGGAIEAELKEREAYHQAGMAEAEQNE